MLPLKEFTGWSTRPSDNRPQIEPNKKYYFICEGANTEKWYFEELVGRSKDFDIPPTVQLIFMEKTGKDIHNSNPKNLLKSAAEIQQNDDFKSSQDVIVLIFDADIYKDNVCAYNEIITEARKNNYLIGVTNPSFELFLLLHKKDCVKNFILPNKTKIIQNEFVGKKRFISKMFTDITKMNSKTNSRIALLVNDLNVAIEQEKFLNQDVDNCIGNLTSNICKIITDIQNK